MVTLGTKSSSPSLQTSRAQLVVQLPMALPGKQALPAPAVVLSAQVLARVPETHQVATVQTLMKRQPSQMGVGVRVVQQEELGCSGRTAVWGTMRREVEVLTILTRYAELQ
jgi:hypothetical protein